MVVLELRGLQAHVDLQDCLVRLVLLDLRDQQELLDNQDQQVLQV